MATAVVAQYSQSNFAGDVRAACSAQDKRNCPPNICTTKVGSALFEVISVLPEYA